MPRWTTIEARFWPRVKKTATCWLWTGTNWGGRKPYGRLQIHGRLAYAHRVSWQIARGGISIPAVLDVLHKCDNHRCVRPSHLFLGTNDDNNKDKALKNRAKKKLEIADVVQIRHLAVNGATQVSIGRRFGITQSQVSRIVSLQRRRHVGGVLCH